MSDEVEFTEIDKPKRGRPPKVETAAEKPEVQKMYPVYLNKNYRPTGKFEIIEDNPPMYPGVGTFSTKLWAGSTVKLERDEAISVVKAKIAERADAFAED